jgi:hypothetical protein
LTLKFSYQIDFKIFIKSSSKIYNFYFFWALGQAVHQAVSKKRPKSPKLDIPFHIKYISNSDQFVSSGSGYFKRLHDCCIVRLHDCCVAGLRTLLRYCCVVRLRDCCVEGCVIVLLQGCVIVLLRARLRDCCVARLRDCAMLILKISTT